MISVYTKTYLKMVVIIVVLIGALNWGLIGAININLVQQFSSLFNQNSYMVSRIIYIIVGLCSLLLIFNRDTYLPFLGEAVIPEQKLSTPEIKDEVKVVLKNLPSDVKVIYWAAQSSDNTFDNPIDAYGDYSNQGVVISNNNGEATLIFNKPAAYKIPSGRTLKPHVHYRYWTEYGIASPVNMVYV